MCIKVQIREKKTEQVEVEVVCLSQREADQVQRGMNINLNRKLYYVRQILEA